MLCISVSYRKTTDEIRQRFSFSENEKREFLSRLIQDKIISGGVILSTCNRSELYVTVNAKHDGIGFKEAENGKSLKRIEEVFSEFKGLSRNEIRKNCLFYQGKKAVTHLYRVVCGLDSMVLGEDEILHQTKEAYQLSQNIGAADGEINILFQGAFNCAKLSKSETHISQTPVSIGTLTANYVEEYVERGMGKEARPEEERLEVARSEAVKSEEARPEEVRSEEVRPEEVRPEEVRPEEARPEEVRPEAVKSEVEESNEVGEEVCEKEELNWPAETTENPGLDGRGRSVLVIGASGQIGSIVAKDLLDKGFSVIGTSRTHTASDALWQSDEMTWIDFGKRYEYIDDVSVVVSATKSPHYTLTGDEFKAARIGRRDILLVDLAVPYDIDRDIGEAEGVKLIGIDHFRELAEKNNTIKLNEAEKMQDIVSECVEDVLKRLYIRDFQMLLPEREDWFSKMIFYLKESLDSDTLLKVLCEIYRQECHDGGM